MDPWLPPRISFSKDVAPSSSPRQLTPTSRASSTKSSSSEFEFSMCAQDDGSSHGNKMLPADQLFHDGKLLPLYTPRSILPQPTIDPPTAQSRGRTVHETIRHMPGTQHAHKAQTTRTTGPHKSATHSAGTQHVIQQPSSSSNAVSPKAPTCTSRWKELFGLKKLHSPDPSRRKQSKHDGFPARRSMDSSMSQHTHNSVALADPGLSPTTKATGISKSTDDADVIYSKYSGSIPINGHPAKGNDLPVDEGTNPKGAEGIMRFAPRIATVTATKLALDRSSSTSSNNSSSPRPPKKRPKQVRRRGPSPRELSRAISLERSPSYSSAGVRVAPVINVPLHFGGPGVLRKGSNSVLTNFLNAKKTPASRHYHRQKAYEGPD